MQEILHFISDALREQYPEQEIRNISYLLIEKITGYSRTDILTNKNTTFSEEQRIQLVSFIEKLKKNVPVQYILGETEFYGMTFLVNESVLIPRPETEELIEWILTDSKTQESIKILDIGTGSGCIAISLGKLLTYAVVDAFDISTAAIDTAKTNSQLNNAKVNFTESDILKQNSINDCWDIIVSNPPYIPEKEKEYMDSNVLQYEPPIALFVPDNDPLLFYRKIAEFALTHLNEDGCLYFEIHYDAGKAILNLLHEMGFKNIELRKDMAGNDRMIKASL